MAENYRTGFVWEIFMKNKEIIKAMDLAGFVSQSTKSTIHSFYLIQLFILISFLTIV
jgi:hypothetical protein